MDDVATRLVICLFVFGIPILGGVVLFLPDIIRAAADWLEEMEDAIAYAQKWIDKDKPKEDR